MLADTPLIASSVFAIVFRLSEPDVIDDITDVLALFSPKLAALWPTFTLPVPTVEPGVTLVIVLNTFVPVEVPPSPAPVISSVISLPAISVPTTVKTVEL